MVFFSVTQIWVLIMSCWAGCLTSLNPGLSITPCRAIMGLKCGNLFEALIYNLLNEMFPCIQSPECLLCVLMADQDPWETITFSVSFTNLHSSYSVFKYALTPHCALGHGPGTIPKTISLEAENLGPNSNCHFRGARPSFTYTALFSFLFLICKVGQILCL